MVEREEGKERKKIKGGRNDGEGERRGEFDYLTGVHRNVMAD